MREQHQRIAYMLLHTSEYTYIDYQGRKAMCTTSADPITNRLTNVLTFYEKGSVITCIEQISNTYVNNDIPF